ncbi:MAG: DUF2851 family protein [Bacteroidetes bacterium]|nr:MAG: DUF2851 family protein [Bacteroidota bacterium]
MREDFLHYLWRWRRFDVKRLQTTDGQPLEILFPGEYNTDAGPDFFNARVRLGNTLWAGNVEIHLKASDWLLHRHDSDPAYANVILHVVLEEDQRLFRPSGERLPCLVLRDRIPPRVLDRYRRLEWERLYIPCARVYHEVPELIRINWLDRLLIERLEVRTAAVDTLLGSVGQHWEEAFYRMLARSFGLKINTAPFEQLAWALPLRILSRHQDNLFQLEALLFGQAGLLRESFRDAYPVALAKEYGFLQHKYDLQPLPAGQWKFFRLRPAGFPTVRIAQLAALLHRSTQLFTQILEAESVEAMETLLQPAVSTYWQTHFRFDKPSARRMKPLGREFVHLLLINAVVPFLFCYGRKHGKEALQLRALQLLEGLPAESNNIVREWSALGQAAEHAARTQALIHLKTQYCKAGRCLECAIGTAILR